MTTTTPATRVDITQSRLRDDILGGKLRPGERLKFPDLTQRYESSIGALRESLTRLEAEGLVQARPHQGYVVTPLSHGDLDDLTTARMEIEPLTLRHSIEDGDMAWEAAAVGAHHVLERTPMFAGDDRSHPSDEWAQAHSAFHVALIAGCRNRRLLSIATALRQEAELYVQWSVTFGREPERDVCGEHRAILEAAIARDGAGAAELLRDHISHTARLLIAVAEDEPNGVREARRGGPSDPTPPGP